MASVSDLVNTKSSTLPVDWIRGAINEGEASSDASIQESRAYRNLSTRTLPDIVNRFASRGTFFSGTARRTAGQAVEDTNNEVSDVERMLARTRNQLQLNRFLAAVGLG
jgi:hypothetical protein